MEGLPKLKNTIIKYHLKGNTILNINNDLAIIEDNNTEISKLIDMCDGSNSYNEIISLSKLTNAEEILNDLVKHNFLENNAFNIENDPNTYDSKRWNRNYDFYGSFLKYNENKYKIQEDLSEKKVCLLGCGGLGSHILLELVSVGFKNITIVDFDQIELSNLNRQILYKESDIGNSKVETAKHRIEEYCSAVKINAINIKIDSINTITDIIAGHDLVISVADKPRNKIIEWLNESCLACNIPYINAGVNINKAIFFSVIPFKTGCATCWKNNVNIDNTIASDVIDYSIENEVDYILPAPAFSPLVSVATGCVLSEAVKILTGISPPSLTNNLKSFCFQNMSMEISENWEKDKNCPDCGNEL